PGLSALALAPEEQHAFMHQAIKELGREGDIGGYEIRQRLWRFQSTIRLTIASFFRFRDGWKKILTRNASFASSRKETGFINLVPHDLRHFNEIAGIMPRIKIRPSLQSLQQFARFRRAPPRL